jgi:hypothetical protein
MDVPPGMTTEDISLLIANSLPEPYASHREDLVLSVQRAWIVEGMPGHELLDTLAQAYQFLSGLVKDAHHRAGHEFETYEHDGENIRRIDGRLPCMITTVEMRTVSIDLATGNILRSVDKVFQSSPAMLKAIRKRYKLPEGNCLPDDPFELAESLLPNAKAILVRDKSHLRLMFIHSSAGWILRCIIARDRVEKYSIIRRIADDVRRIKADSIVEIAEVWCAPIHGDRLPYNPATAKDRKELLVISVATNKGLFRSYLTPLSRSILGSIRLGKTEVANGSMPPYLAPLCEVWGLPTPTPVENEVNLTLPKDSTDK